MLQVGHFSREMLLVVWRYVHLFAARAPCRSEGRDGAAVQDLAEQVRHDLCPLVAMRCCEPAAHRGTCCPRSGCSPQVYACAGCRSHLVDYDDLVSKVREGGASALRCKNPTLAFPQIFFGPRPSHPSR